MKLSIHLRREGEKQISYTADLKDHKIENYETANLLFTDMTKSDMARGWELVRWQIKRWREKWKGLAHEKSPRLQDGDEIIFHARKATDA